MKRHEIDEMLRRMGAESHADPANAIPRRWFYVCMQHRQYGYEPLLSAWNHFLEGYSSACAELAQVDHSESNPD